MKTFYATIRHIGCWLFLAWLSGGSALLRAQGPTVDPGFLCYSVAVEAYARQVVQQANGQRVLLGSFREAGGSASNGLVRLLAGSNQPDPVFQANTAGLSTAEVDQLVAPCPTISSCWCRWPTTPCSAWAALIGAACCG